MQALITRLGGRWTKLRFERETADALPLLYRTARRLTPNRADAEDLVQETCVRAFRARGTVAFHNRAAHRGWLLRILTNAYRDLYRHQRRACEIELITADDEAGPDLLDRIASPLAGPAQAASAREFLDAAQNAMEELTPEVRLVVALYFVDDLSCREIAEIIDCPMGTVQSRLARGRRRLRERLAPYAAGSDRVDDDADKPQQARAVAT